MTRRARCARTGVVVALTGAAMAAPSLPAQTVEGMRPSTVRPGDFVAIVGHSLRQGGLDVEIVYEKRYLATPGETREVRIRPVSVTPDSILFRAPSNVRPTYVYVFYRPTSSAYASHPRANALLPAAALYVLEPPVITGTGAMYIADVARPVLRPGRTTIRGRHLAPFPRGDVALTFAGRRVQVVAGPTYNRSGASGRGEDTLVIELAEPPASELAAVSYTTPGGTFTEDRWLRPRLPRITAVEKLNDNGTVSGPANGVLERGKRYQVRGTDLAYPASPPFLIRSLIRLSTTGSANGAMSPTADTVVNSGLERFTVPTTLTATNVSLFVTHTGGDGGGGAFTVTNPGAVPPPLAGFLLSPNPTVRGDSVVATISFAGSIPAGGGVGEVVISAPNAGVFTEQSRTVPITANPMVVTLRSPNDGSGFTTQIKARLTRLTGSADSLTSSIQFSAPRLTDLRATGVASGGSVPGGSTAEFEAVFDTPTGGNWSCPVVPTLSGTVMLDVEISDTSVVKLVTAASAYAGQSATRICATRNPEKLNLTTTAPSTPRTVTITVRKDGVAVTRTLTVQPAAITNLLANRTALTSLQSATGTVTVSSAAAGAYALFSSSDPSVSVPAKLPLTSSLTLQFPITTLPVVSARTVTISASVGSSTRTMSLTLQPLAFGALGFSSSTVRTGSSTTATVPLNATIDLPFTATVTSSDPTVVTVPPTVAFAAGQNAAIFAVQAVAGRTQQASATVTVTYTVTLPNGTPVTTTTSGVVTVTP